MNTKIPVHFADNYLLQPVNPITVNLIGAGGTGSRMLACLNSMNESLLAMGHAGLQVTVYDDDFVSEANLGRQLFSRCELGLYKSVALANRFNRFSGTNWKAVNAKFEKRTAQRHKDSHCANIFITCVDTVNARFEIADILKVFRQSNSNGRNKPMYWMDCGNAQFTGQAILSTISPIKQPDSEQFETVAILPMVTNEFKPLLEKEVDNNEPSCSVAEALMKQDLFINADIANLGASLLWRLFREGLTEYRGFFFDLKNFRLQPLKVA